MTEQQRLNSRLDAIAAYYQVPVHMLSGRSKDSNQEGL